MSKQSWLAEFYPIEASSPTLKTNLKRVQHSLQKWRGLRPAALSKHGIRLNCHNQDLYFDNQLVLTIDGCSCALCVRHADSGLFGGELGCSSCPLSRARGGCRCDWAMERELYIAPWQEWTYNHNPEPMIKYLEMAENALIKEAERRK